MFEPLLNIGQPDDPPPHEVVGAAPTSLETGVVEGPHEPPRFWHEPPLQAQAVPVGVELEVGI